MSDAPQTRTDSLTPPPNGRSSEVEALTTALAEARWQQSLLASIVAQVPVGVFVADAKTGLPLLVNQAGIDLLGRGLDPHRRKDESAEVYPNYLPGTQQLYPVQDLPLVRTMSSGEPARAEMDIQRPDGRVRIEMVTTPIRDTVGRVISAVAVLQPVLQRPTDNVASQEAEAIFRQAIEAAGAVPYRRDHLIGQYTYMGEGIHTITGYRSDEMTVDLFESLIEENVLMGEAKQQTLTVPDAVQLAQSGQLRVWRSDIRLRTQDGQTRWVADSSIELKDDLGNAIGSVGILQDITERKQNEATLARRAAELEETRNFLETVIEALPVGLFMKDAEELRFVRWNKANEDLIGLKREAVLNKNDYDFFPPEEADWFSQKDREVVRGGQLLDIPEETVKTAHRGERILHTRKVPILGTDGQPKYLLGISEDITERKQADQALREREEDLAALLEFSPEAIGVVNTQTGLFDNVNSAAERLYGLPRDELVKVGPAQMSPEFQPDGRPSLEAAMEKIGAALQGGRPVFDWTHRNAAGQLIPCEIRLVGLAAPRQHLVRFSATDITERKHVEEERRFQASLLAAQNEASIEGVLIVTADGQKILNFNQRFAQLWELPQDVVDTRVDAEVLRRVADQVSNFDEFLAKVQYLYQHPAESSRDEIYLKNGRIFDRYTGPIKDGENIHGRVWFFRDITERKQAEAALAQRAAELQDATTFLDSVIDNLPTMLFVKEAQTLRFVRWNKAGEDLLGFPREAMVGKNDHDFFPKEEADFFTAKDREVLTGGQLVDIAEEPIQTAHRGLRLLHTRKIPILDAHGQPKYLLGISEDITERKQADAALGKRATELEVVAQVGTAAATILDPSQLLQTVVDLTKTNFKLYHAHVYTLNETGDTLELAAGAGEVGHKMVSQGWRIPSNREQSLVARAARTRQGLIVNDVRAAPDFLPNPLLPDTRSEMALPIIASDRVLGVLDVQADEPDHFTEEDLRIQSILATQIAVALQNARQFAEARRLADRETLVNAISQQIQSATTVESALQIAARELGRALGAQRTVVQLGQSDKSPR